MLPGWGGVICPSPGLHGRELVVIDSVVVGVASGVGSCRHWRLGRLAVAATLSGGVKGRPARAIWMRAACAARSTAVLGMAGGLHGGSVLTRVRTGTVPSSRRVALG